MPLFSSGCLRESIVKWPASTEGKMKISPQTFFNFCADHVPLLRVLKEQEAEVSEADVRRLIRSTASDELPETTWRRLGELQILVPVEPGSDFYFMAEQVSRLLSLSFRRGKCS
jgi:hypothetical protein